MSSKQEDNRILVGGLGNSGKTTFICSLLSLATKQGRNFAGFKPFDVGLLDHNAKEEKSDGEWICEHMQGEPMVTLVSPYLAHESYPVELSFRRDGIRIDWNHIDDRLKLLDRLYDKTLIEMPPGLLTSLTEDKLAYQWGKEVSKQVIWMIRPEQHLLESNLSQINLLQTAGFKIFLVFNNCSKKFDQDLIFYFWEKLEKFAEQQLEGMIPYFENPRENIDPFIEKLKENLPTLINYLF